MEQRLLKKSSECAPKLRVMIKMKTLQKKFSILYFDDEEACLDIFQQFFEDEYEVRTVSTLAEARAALCEGHFDIIISDQLMPEIGGLAFLREVARNQPEAFRIMLTGSTSLSQVIVEVGVGIIQLFITKPWVEPGMRQVLERAIMSITNRNTTSRRASESQATRNAA